MFYVIYVDVLSFVSMLWIVMVGLFVLMFIILRDINYVMTELFYVSGEASVCGTFSYTQRKTNLFN